MKLKATISNIVRVTGKNNVHIELHSKFLPSCSALLFIWLLRVFFKLQTDFTDARRRQIHYLKKTSVLSSCHDNDILLKRAFSRIPNVSEFF